MSGISFAECRRRLAASEPRLTDVGRGCHIYGAGGFGRRIARELARLDIRVLGFIDRSARERATVDGLSCRHPDDLTDGEIEGAAYVHGLMNHYVSSHRVADWAAARGFAQSSSRRSCLPSPGFPSRTTGWRRARRRSIDSTRSRPCMRLWTTTRAALCCAACSTTGFRPTRGAIRTSSSRKPTSRVSCPSSIGRSPSWMAEPIPATRWRRCWPTASRWPTGSRSNRTRATSAALIETARRHRPSLGAYTLMKAGLSDASGTVRFADGDGEASRVVGPQDAAAAGLAITDIQVVKLDDVVSRGGEIYVKLDIEGAEREALRGMTEILARRPTVAVSVYHQPSDLWAIPQAIAALYDRPRFRLRQHGHHGFDTVLYVTAA